MTTRVTRFLVCALCAFALLGAVSAMGNGVERLIKPAGNGKYLVPESPSNKIANVTYACLPVRASEFHNGKDMWLVGFRDMSDAEYAHHYNAFTLPADAPGLAPGGSFENIEHLQMIDDCVFIGGGSNQFVSGQPGNIDLDLLSDVDGDKSTKNGYSYGIPIGAQRDAEWIIIQAHIHNFEGRDDLEISLKYKMRVTEDAPDKELGIMFTGVIPPTPVFGGINFMDIPENEDGLHTITSYVYPAAADCSTDDSLVPCQSCCPSGNGPVSFSSPDEGALLAQNQPSVELVTSFLHAHGTLMRLEAWKLAFDGTETLIDECIGCGAGSGKNAFRILDSPIPFHAGEGVKVKCTYNRSYDGGHAHEDGDMDESTNIVGGYRSDEEMCQAYFHYAYDRPMPNPGSFILKSDYCNYVQNEGYPNENNPLGPAKPFFCPEKCVRDPACPPDAQ